MDLKVVAGVAALLVSTVASAEDAGPPSYVAVQTIALRPTAAGVDRVLVLSMDRRLTEPVRNQLWGRGEWSLVLPEETLREQFSTLPPVGAKVIVRDAAGRAIAQRTLGTPLARIQAWHPSPRAGEVFLLTEDDSAGFGSYGGAVTLVLEVSDVGLREVTALDPEARTEMAIRLASTGEADWRIVSGEDGDEIVSVSCRREGDDGLVEYVTYRVEGGRWVARKRERAGCWDPEEPFPDRSAFP